MASWRPRQQPDRLRRGPAAAIIGTCIALLLVVAALCRLLAPVQPGPAPATPAPTLHHRPADPMLPATRERTAARERRDRTGWVDRHAGVVHVPVALVVDWFLADAAEQP